MIVLGLTGSIGMGKTSASAMFRRLGLPVHDADAAVHRLLARGGAAVPAIAEAFPAAVVDGAVDRGSLGREVFGNPAALRRLEAIVHPLVRRETRAFLARQRRQRRDLVVLDIPLYFETGGGQLCDAVVVVSAPAFVQRQRVLRRAGMTAARFQAIQSRQLPDAEKRRRADFVVETGLGKGHTLHQLARIVRLLRHGRRKPRRRGA